MSLGLPEIMLIFLLALLLFGPRKLPELGRTLGRAMNEFRRAADELKTSLEREVNLSGGADLKDLTKDLRDATATVRDIGASINPLADVRATVQDLGGFGPFRDGSARGREVGTVAPAASDAETPPSETPPGADPAGDPSPDPKG